jgi:hypothetical protein
MSFPWQRRENWGKCCGLEPQSSHERQRVGSRLGRGLPQLSGEIYDGWMSFLRLRRVRLASFLTDNDLQVCPWRLQYVRRALRHSGLPPEGPL